jgi:hypothetical protein
MGVHGALDKGARPSNNLYMTDSAFVVLILKAWLKEGASGEEKTEVPFR